MSTVSLYTFERAEGEDFGTYTTDDYTEACDYAKANGLRVIENEYEFADSSLVADYTEEGR